MFERIMVASWGDMDFNAHMRNTAFLDKSADIRLAFFAAHGMPAAELARLRIGPVVRKDEIEYFKEVRLLEEIRVTIAAAGLSDDCARFVVRNEFFRIDGTLAARIISSGGWLDLTARRLIVPPEALQRAMQAMPRTEHFAVLPSLKGAQ